MFGRSQYPHYLRNEAGKRPTSAAELADGRWLATWPESLAIVSADGAREEYDWAEFEYGRWDEETSELSLALTRRGRGEPIVLVLADGSDPSVVTMVHERIERSIVHQLVWIFPAVEWRAGKCAVGATKNSLPKSFQCRHTPRPTVPPLPSSRSNSGKLLGYR